MDQKRIISVISSIILLLVVTEIVSARQQAVGIIVGGYGDNCTVQRAGSSTKDSCRYGLELYNGDTITKMPLVRDVKIQWLAPPYTHGVENDSMTLRIVFDTPPKISWLSQTLHFLGLSSIEHNRAQTASRGDSRRKNELIQPGLNVTVLPMYLITFSWNVAKAKTIQFFDSKGEKIYERDVSKTNSIELSPESIGMRPSEVYSWKIEGANFPKRQNKLRLVKNELSMKIDRDLRDIGRMAGDVNLLKASYLQSISDENPKEVDLYWLSSSILKDIDYDKNIFAKVLLTNYLQHEQRSPQRLK